MGSKDSMILKEPPKKLEYTKNLLNYTAPETIFDRAKSFFVKNISGPHSKSKWCEIIGSTPNNANAIQYIEYLIDENVLEFEKKKSRGDRCFNEYSLNRDQLLKCFYDSDYYSWHRKVFAKTMKKHDSGYKVEKVTI